MRFTKGCRQIWRYPKASGDMAETSFLGFSEVNFTLSPKGLNRNERDTTAMRSIRTKFSRIIFAVALAAILSTSSAHAAQKFEYKVVHYEIVTGGGRNLDEQRVADLQAALNKLGAEGWELVILDSGGLAVFKRPL
jgi:Domain of unknown function (DUF4177)